MHDLDEFLGRESLRRVPSDFGIYHVLANVVLDDLRDETIQSAATGGRLLQHRGAFMSASTALSMASIWPRMRFKRFSNLPFSFAI